MEVLLMAALVIAYMVNSRIGALLLLPVAAFYMFAKKGTIYEKLLRVIVFSAPYYIFSIWGDRQRLSVCIVASVVLCALLTISWLRRGAQGTVGTAYKGLLLLLFLISYTISVLFVPDPKETFFVTYQLVVLVYLLVIIPVCKNWELKSVDIDALLRLFVKGTCGLVIALYVQYGADVLLGVSIGEIFRYNTGRAIYNLYFYAKSVLSLYISMGMLYFFIDFINKKRFADIVWIALFAGAILINNSRTGLASFAVSAILYCVLNSRLIFGSIRVTAILVLAAAAGMYIVQFMLESRANLVGILDDNGRWESILQALELLPKHIIRGIGGSTENYLNSGIKMVPHNFFVAFLLQFGILGGLAANILLLCPMFAHKKNTWYYLCCIIIGGMLFANWQNCVFILPVYLFTLLEKETPQEELSERTQ